MRIGRHYFVTLSNGNNKMFWRLKSAQRFGTVFSLTVGYRRNMREDL